MAESGLRSPAHVGRMAYEAAEVGRMACGGWVIRFWGPHLSMLRSYHPEHTGSHQNSEVKLDWAGLVLC